MSERYGRQEGVRREAENHRPLGPDVDSEGHAAAFVAHRKLGTERQYERAAVKRSYGSPATAGAPANSSP